VLCVESMSNLLILDVMKVWLIFLLFPVSLFAQVIDKAEIEAYVHTIDSLKNKNELEVFMHPHWSSADGFEDGYYFNGNLVFLDSRIEFEEGFIHRSAYFKGGDHVMVCYSRLFNKPVKIIAQKRRFIAVHPSYRDSTCYFLFDGSKILYTIQNDSIYEGKVDTIKLQKLMASIQTMKKELYTEKERSIIFTKDLAGDFSYTEKWEYPLGVYINQHDQVSCDGFCPEGAWGFRDEEGKIYEDSLEAFYALVDTTHEFHSLNSQAHQYEWYNSDFMTFTKLEGYSYSGISAYDAGNHSRLHIEISGSYFKAYVDFNSVTSTPRTTFQLKSGILVLDEEAQSRGILKGKFDFTFKNTLDSEVPLTWKGTFYSGPNQIKVP
jgi:hypothetical protein